jgi:hypothetical protein
MASGDFWLVVRSSSGISLYMVFQAQLANMLLGEVGETRTTNTLLRWIIILVRETANIRRHKLQSSKLDTNARCTALPVSGQVPELVAILDKCSFL